VSGPIAADAARRIRLVILDVDGVLTDGGLYVGVTDDGTPLEFKRFDITDQLGVKMLVWSGLTVALVSGRPSVASRLRADELGVPYHPAPGGFKVPEVDKLREGSGAGWSEVACVCDDLADLPVMQRAGLAVAVRNAVTEVRAAAHWVTSLAGGRGAVREFAEALLRARGEWNTMLETYVRDREGVR
jgi:3-deoxy-D-manno-octulosonate 8-phosphate phosphatase (KDO 8-P phosphatase)